MTRKTGISVENNFVSGFVTETTALRFPPNGATATSDCIFDETGKVRRRKGIDLEAGYTLNTVTLETNEVFREYQWTAVAGVGSKSFLVQQQGSTLHFYNTTTDTTVTDNKHATTISLDSYQPTATTEDAATYPVFFSSGNGVLFATSEVITPLYITYDTDADTITAATILIQERDIQGVDDGLAITERPAMTVGVLKTSNPEHYYNVLNQGWHIADSLGQWATARSDTPSNADYVALTRQSETDAFQDSRVDANSAGNRPAPKGHFILDVSNPNRTAAMSAEDYNGGIIADESPIIDHADGTAIGDMTAGGALAAAFDEDKTTTAGSCAQVTATSGYVGKNFSTSNRLGGALIYGSSDQGYETTNNGAMTATFYAKNSLPTSGTDGTILGTISFTDTADESSPTWIESTDTATEYDYAWVYIERDDQASGTYHLAEVEFYTPTFTFFRPKLNAFFAGRTWYSGARGSTANNVYFSQIIQNKAQYGLCYQVNDPTDENFADLLPDDGGRIKIPEMGTLHAMFPYQTSLILIASNGIWTISGGAGAFAAEDYSVRRISAIGTDSDQSVVNIRGIPIWWAEDGIYTVEFDSNFDSFSVKSVTEDRIKSFITSIPTLNRQYVKGAFDATNDMVVWVYNDTASLTQANYYVYTKALVMNSKTQAFYPWTIGDSDPEIRGIVYVQAGDRTDDALVKFTTTINIDASNERLIYAEEYNTSYKDWTLYDTDIGSGTGTDEINYSSYFVTGYKIDGETLKFFQPNYVAVFLDKETDASAYMQGVYDFTNTGDSGKWSMKQQCYSPARTGFVQTNRDVNFRRLKVRGKGRSLQLRFISEDGKPFTIIGWSIFETSNANV